MADLPDLVLRRQIHDLTLRVTRLEEAVLGAPVSPQAIRPAVAPSPAREAPRSQPAVEPRVPAPVRFNPPFNKSSVDLERLIGGKTFAVVGAVAVVVAAGLFLKLAYDQGWLGRIPDGWKCVLSALFGIALLGVGEGALRRWGRLASMGLTAAGLGVVYTSAFAAYGFYHLLSAPIVFALLATIVALGIGLSARARRVPVAILSTLAGYAIPLLLLDAHGPALILPAHLLAMLIVALVLCALLGHAFSPVRAVAWWATILLGAYWTLGHFDTHPTITLCFIAGFWMLVHGELIWSARRDDARDTTAHDPDIDDIDHPSLHHLMRPLCASFSLTAWTTALGAITLQHGLHAQRALAPATMFVATGLLWIIFAGALRVLRERPRTRLQALGVALAAQSGALLIIAGALALTGFTESIAGLALGVAAVFAARWLDARALRWYGVVALTLATGRLLLIDFSSAMDMGFAPGFAGWSTRTLGEIVFTRWTLLAAFGAAAWFASAALTPLRREHHATFDEPSNPRLPGAILGAALLALGFVSRDASAQGLFAAWLACAVVFAYALRPFGRLEASAIGLFVWILALIAWAVAWPPNHWSADHAPAFAHPGFLTTGALLAALLVIRLSASRAPADSPAFILRASAAALGLLLVLVASSAETSRIASIVFHDSTAKYASLTVWWAVFATALIIAGFVRTTPIVRHLGLALLSLAAGKAVLYDLAEVQPAWRIASFLGVGLFMLAVATGYTRIARSSRSNHDEPEPEPVSH